MGKNQDPGSGLNIPDPQYWGENTKKNPLISELVFGQTTTKLV
jgi:hypothetical protein